MGARCMSRPCRVRANPGSRSDAPMKPADSPAAAATKSTAHAAKTNGSRYFLGRVDERSVNARRLRDIERGIVAELGVPLAALSTADRALLTQASTLTLRAEVLQSAAARDEPVDDDVLVRLTTSLRLVRRDLERRRPAPKPPNLHDYLAGKTAAEPA